MKRAIGEGSSGVVAGVKHQSARRARVLERRARFATGADERAMLRVGVTQAELETIAVPAGEPVVKRGKHNKKLGALSTKLDLIGALATTGVAVDIVGALDVPAGSKPTGMDIDN